MLIKNKRLIISFAIKYLIALAIFAVALEIFVYRKTAFSAEFFGALPWLFVVFIVGVLITSLWNGWIKLGEGR